MNIIVTKAVHSNNHDGLRLSQCKINANIKYSTRGGIYQNRDRKFDIEITYPLSVQCNFS